MSARCATGRVLGGGRLVLLVPVYAVVFSGAIARGNQVVNGGFEQNSGFVERALFPGLDDVNGSAPTGWTRDGGTLAEYIRNVAPYQGVALYNMAEGNHAIAMHGGEWWEKSFATVPGARYSLTFSVAFGAVWYEAVNEYYRPGSTPGVVSLTGNSLLASAGFSGTASAPTGAVLQDAPFVWSLHSVNFIADSASTTLRFAGPVNADEGYIFVDDARVVVVPTPLGALLGIGGVVSVCAVRRRGVLDGRSRP